MSDKLYKKLTQYRFHSNEIVKTDKGVVIERSVSLFVNGQDWLAFMCLPIDLDALAVGFLYNEGIINHASDLRLVEIHHSGKMVEVWLNKDVEKPDHWKITSGCSGGATTATGEMKSAISHNRRAISKNQLFDLQKKLFDNQGLYREVGGVHASALSDGKDLILVCEDIGRHNTLDKLSGKILLNNLKIKYPILLTSGRVSSEMMQKASRLNAPIVITRTSPTSYSIELALEYGITLIGYARGKRFNIYSHPHRVVEYNQPSTDVE